MNVFNQLYLLLSLLALVAYVPTILKKQDYAQFVVLYLIILVLTFLASIYSTNILKLRNNLFIFHIATPLEYSVLALLYRSVIVNGMVKKIIAFSIPLFIVVSIASSIFLQPLTTNNSNTIILASVIIVFLTLFFLRETLLLQQVTVLHQFPMFWVSVGILFYYTGNLIIEGMLNYMITHSMELARRTFMIGYIFKYLLFILFIIGAFFSRTSSRELKNR
jgi:hypothetical protein